MNEPVRYGIVLAAAIVGSALVGMAATFLRREEAARKRLEREVWSLSTITDRALAHRTVEHSLHPAQFEALMSALELLTRGAPAQGEDPGRTQEPTPEERINVEAQERAVDVGAASIQQAFADAGQAVTPAQAREYARQMLLGVPIPDLVGVPST